MFLTIKYFKEHTICFDVHRYLLLIGDYLPLQKIRNLIFSSILKFGLSENLPHGFDESADLLSKRQNHEEDFFKFCVFLRKPEL